MLQSSPKEVQMSDERVVNKCPVCKEPITFADLVAEYRSKMKRYFLQPNGLMIHKTCQTEE